MIDHEYSRLSVIGLSVSVVFPTITCIGLSVSVVFPTITCIILKTVYWCHRFRSVSGIFPGHINLF